MARCTGLFLLVVFIAAFAATYNTLTFVLRSRFSPYEGHPGESDLGLRRSSLRIQSQAQSGSDSGEESAISLAGTVLRPKDFIAQKKRESSRRFHTAVTADIGAYTKWQCRVMYYWYKKTQAMPGGEDMGGYTRILHSGQEDNLVGEIPTWVAQPLPPGVDKGYVVLNRPWAFVQWLQQVEIEEQFVLMAEPDHIFVKPLPNLAQKLSPVAFPFFYINAKENEAVLRRWLPNGPITFIDPVGNSPVIIHKDDLAKVAPTWQTVSLEMKNDPGAEKAFGWVLEMYAYAAAVAMHGIAHELRKDFMIQPPWDTQLGSSFIIHYTYGCDYTRDGVFTPGKIGEWRFDKRSYSGGAPPRNLTMPPPGVPPAVVELISRINEATFALPGWLEGAT